jgi:tetratricopeptide (TPR) repeat protein
MTMRKITTMGAAALCILVSAGTAYARNPHCAGGIQYVVNGMKDKDKGNMEDYERQMNKAVNQLETCSSEDPADFEAVGYLGWAYAELGHYEKAGTAFNRSIDGLAAKGDKKKAEWAKNNRESYWANSFNAGIGSINTARELYDPYDKEPADDAEKALKQEAGKHFESAIKSLENASALKPTDAQTIRNLGISYALMGRYDEAAAIFQKGLAAVPGDKELSESLKSVRTQHANRLIDAKKYDEAIGYFVDLIKTSPDDADLYLGLGDARFRRAQTLDSNARAAAFKEAGEAYAKASEMRGGDADLSFNAALAFQNAGEWQKSVGQWETTLSKRPDDIDALTAYAAALSEVGKPQEAVEALLKALAKKPKEATIHRQLGAVYTKANDNEKATEELMVYLALSKGQPVADPAAQAAKAAKTSNAGKTLASMGAPEEVIPWEADGEKYETWFYWSKHRAFHFKGGTLQVESDWSASAKYATAGDK